MRGTRVTALALGVLLMSAACGPSSQSPETGSTTSTSLTNPVPSSSAGRASLSTPSATTNKTTKTTSTTTNTTSRTIATTSTTSSKPTIRPSTTTPTATIAPSLVGRVVSRIPTSRKVVALTFDAGANGDGVDSILATLARDKVAGSFFLTGDFVNRYPTLARRMSAMGRLGNHTTNHPHLPAMTDDQVRAQIAGARTTILNVTGEDPRPLFRFPFGDSSSHDLEMVSTLGYVTIGWTVDSLGWQGTSGGRSVDSIVQRVLHAATPGEIVLMHVGSHPTDHSTLDANALPRVISGLRAAGYSFVTLDTLVS
jgi:peptidoglycan/xylan/chitin deacetylase (PgdA/CDA1 family)